LARHAEQWGYRRYWLAEHHNMVGIASAATAVVIGYVAGGTLRIRVGAGGIMLPNHAPLIVAEQFGTLETLYPGRINLGLGRARHRPAHASGVAPRSDQRRHLPAGCAGVAGPLGTTPAGAGRAGGARHGAQGSDLDPGLEPLW